MNFIVRKKKLSLIVLSLFVLFLLPFHNIVKAGPQQTITVSGTVLDAYEIPIIGANILEKGTTNGTVSDLDGNFTLNVTNRNHRLEVSYIGYLTKEVAIDQKNHIFIVL